jgi:hypothetical protein
MTAHPYIPVCVACTGDLQALQAGRNLNLNLYPVAHCRASLQALSDVLASPAAAAKSIAARADRRYFWNRVMAAPLLGE